jgi:protein gp37
MGANSKIKWTDHTFNPWIGCTKVSVGCRNCYAKTSDDRHLFGQISHWGPGAPRRRTSESNWREPIRWAKRAQAAGVREKVFCASQADVFDAEAPEGAQRDLFNLIHMTSDWLDWLLVTKRPERIHTVMEAAYLWPEWFLDHRCWLLTSTENQDAADKRVPSLLEIPAAVHGVSAEPLLGLIRFDRIGEEIEGYLNALAAVVHCDGRGTKSITGLDWVICGGESGHGARPMNPAWARSLRDQCKVTGTAFFFKQWGEFAPIESPIGNAGDVVRGQRQLVQLDGTHFNKLFLEDVPAGAQWMERQGKKDAGSLLDGQEHKAFPEVLDAR